MCRITYRLTDACIVDDICNVTHEVIVKIGKCLSLNLCTVVNPSADVITLSFGAKSFKPTN